jgi:hypothetical protein
MNMLILKILLILSISELLDDDVFRGESFSICIHIQIKRAVKSANE